MVQSINEAGDRNSKNIRLHERITSNVHTNCYESSSRDAYGCSIDTKGYVHCT